MATPGFVAATRMPPIAAPVTLVALRPSRRSALASCKTPSGTTCGMIPVLAGKKKADEAPFTVASTASSQSLAPPTRSVTPATAWLAPLMRFEPTITRLRRRRSPKTPPKREQQDDGRLSRSQHDPDSRRRAVKRVQDCKREGHRRHCAAEHRNRAPCEEEAELAFPKRPETAHATCGAQRCRFPTRPLWHPRVLISTCPGLADEALRR